jgi:phytoene/squalene synthetase
VRPFAFYQERLDAVSRSFALCIPTLDAPLRDHVALAYLLLRVLDTIEDAPFTDSLVRGRQFRRLRGFLRTLPVTREVRAFAATFPAALPEGERALVLDTRELLEDAHGLPAPVRDVIFETIDRMAGGMATYARRTPPLRLVDLEDVTRYCCFVAGTVGEMLTRLWAVGREMVAPDRSIASAGEAGARQAPPPPMTLAYRFGVFLQKVNILKDQAEDEAAGRYLVPDRRALLASLPADGRGALAYLRALPTKERGFRVFCAWALMLGAATVAGLDGPRESRRAETAKLLARTSAIAGNDDALGALFAELMPALPPATPFAALSKPESHEWFRSSLGAPLSDAELRVLTGAR